MLSRRDQALLIDVVRQAAIAVRDSGPARELQDSREQLVLQPVRRTDAASAETSTTDWAPCSAAWPCGWTPRVTRSTATPTPPADSSCSRAPRSPRRSRTCADSCTGWRPPALDDLGLLAAVEQQADRLRSRGLPVEVQADAVSSLPAAVEVAAYRIVSEALTNVARHAGAAACTVTLRLADSELAVQVRDDGAGIAEEVVAGVGLRSMRERVDELGGRYEVVCPPQGGTTVRAWLPMSQGTA